MNNKFNYNLPLMGRDLANKVYEAYSYMDPDSESYKGLHFIVNGDLKRIVVEELNQIEIIVCLGFWERAACVNAEFRISIPDHMQDYIRNLKTDTGVVLEIEVVPNVEKIPILYWSK